MTLSAALTRRRRSGEAGLALVRDRAGRLGARQQHPTGSRRLSAAGTPPAAWPCSPSAPARRSPRSTTGNTRPPPTPTRSRAGGTRPRTTSASPPAPRTYWSSTWTDPRTRATPHPNPGTPAASPAAARYSTSSPRTPASGCPGPGPSPPPAGDNTCTSGNPTPSQLGNTAGRLGWKIDTRGHGGYVVAAGSVTRGQRYRADLIRRTAKLPEWITTALDTTPLHALHMTSRVVRDAGPYALAALTGELDKLLAATPGHRNDTLNRAAFALGQLVGAQLLDEAIARDELVVRRRPHQPSACRGRTHHRLRTHRRHPPPPSGAPAGPWPDQDRSDGKGLREPYSGSPETPFTERAGDRQRACARSTSIGGTPDRRHAHTSVASTPSTKPGRPAGCRPPHLGGRRLLGDQLLVRLRLRTGDRAKR